MGFDVGDLKRVVERLKNYYAIVNYIMMGSIYVKLVGWRWWYLLVIPGLWLVAWVDARYVHPREAESVARKNPIFMETLRRVTDIHNKFINDKE